MADVWAATVEPSAGDVFVTHDGIGGGMAAVIKDVLLVAAQPAAAPLAFFGAIYQPYQVAAVRPVAV